MRFLKIQVLKVFIFYLLALSTADAQLKSYFESVALYLGYGQHEEVALEGFQQSIPYEVSVEDEKFISQAMQLTNQAVSELDGCQHRVILKLKAECHSMNDETLSKVAVMLLNCQSSVEGRQMYPCNDQMSIKQCTTEMDGDAWNSYHLMSNRVRAVCYSIRQVQFRGMTEHTINRLMDTAKHQVNVLDRIAVDQNKLEEVTRGTLKTMADGQAELAEQQKDLHQAQLFGQLAIENNIKRLADEKLLILESQEHLASMSRILHEKIDEAYQQMENQAEETNEKHRELLDDLIAIKETAQSIFQRIGESSHLLIKQNELAQRHYDAMLKQLAEVNATIGALVSLVGGTKQALEERMVWLTESLGGTDDAIERMYTILWHVMFLLLVMVACAFIGVGTSVRLTVITIVPCNLFLALYKYEQALEAVTLAGVLIILVTIQSVYFSLKSLMDHRQGIALLPWKASSPHLNTEKTTEDTEFCTQTTDNSSDRDSEIRRVTATPPRSYKFAHEDSPELNAPPTPAYSRSSGYFSNGLRGRTPLANLKAEKSACGAITRAGTPCKTSAMPGRDFCYRHLKGDSVMG